MISHYAFDPALSPELEIHVHQEALHLHLMAVSNRTHQNPTPGFPLGQLLHLACLSTRCLLSSFFQLLKCPNMAPQSLQPDLYSVRWAPPSGTVTSSAGQSCHISPGLLQGPYPTPQTKMSLHSGLSHPRGLASTALPLTPSSLTPPPRGALPRPLQTPLHG